MASIQEAIRTDEEVKARSSRNKRLRLGIPSEREETTEDAYVALGKDKPAGMDRAVVTHKSDRFITMYARPYGERRAVPEGSVRVCLSEGLFLDCPVCGGDHPDSGVCPSLPLVAFRRCPICGKRFADDRAVPEATATDEPGLIPTDLPGTPEARTKAKMEAHLVVYHEEAARRAGLLTAAEAHK